MSTLRARKRARRNQPLPLFMVGFACNGDHGEFRGTIDAMSIGRNGDSIDFEWSSGSAPRLTVLDGAIRVFRRRFVHHGATEWYGNWCWNAYKLALPDVATLLERARFSEKFSCDGATGDAACDLSDLFEDDAPRHMIEWALMRFGGAR
jgi:hypothetical protein